MPLVIDFKAIGFKKAQSDLRQMGARARSPQPAFKAIFAPLEESHAELFASLGGKYVDTGALRDSLTQPNANGALREIHGAEMQFGSTLDYAVFQREDGKSAVLRLRPKDRKKASLTYLAYITRGLA